MSQEFSIYPSMMTFNEYNLTFIRIKDPILSDSWGWYVDLESNNEKKIQLNSKYFYKSSKIVSKSIRSIKSKNNLEFNVLEYENKNNYRTNKITKFIYCNTIGLLTIAIIYYIFIIN